MPSGRSTARLRRSALCVLLLASCGSDNLDIRNDLRAIQNDLHNLHARIQPPGAPVLVVYREGSPNVSLVQLKGSQAVELFVHRGGWWLTDSTWKWTGASGAKVELVPDANGKTDGRRVRISALDPSASIGFAENLFVTEHDPQGQAVKIPGSTDPLRAEIMVQWNP
ncbi:MAG: hypothetical protein R3F56_21045 [Planctomycetota bacterium]